MEITEILSRIDAKTAENEVRINAQFSADESEIKQKIAELESEKENINLDSETEKTRIRDAYSTIIGTKLKIKEGTKAVKRENEARDRLIKGIDRNANVKRAEIDAKIEAYNAELVQKTRENQAQLQDARQSAEQDKQDLAGAYLDVEAANHEIQSINEEIQKLQEAIESLEKDKKACEDEIRKLQGRWVQGENGELTKTREQLEYENDLQQIESELASKASEISALNDRKIAEEAALVAANQTIQAMLEKYPDAEKNKDEEQRPEPVLEPEPVVEEAVPTPKPVEETIPTPMPGTVLEAIPEQELEPEPVEESRPQPTGEVSENAVLKKAQYFLAKEFFKEVTEQEKIEIANGNFNVFDDIWKRIDEEPIVSIEEYWKEMAKEELGMDDKNSITRRIFSVLSQTEKEKIADGEVAIGTVLYENHPNEANEYFLLRNFEGYKVADKILVMCQKECGKEKQQPVGEPKTPEDNQNKEKEQLTNDGIAARIFAVLTEKEKEEVAAFSQWDTYSVEYLLSSEHPREYITLCAGLKEKDCDEVQWKVEDMCAKLYPDARFTENDEIDLANDGICHLEREGFQALSWKEKMMIIHFENSMNEFVENLTEQEKIDIAKGNTNALKFLDENDQISATTKKWMKSKIIETARKSYPVEHKMAQKAKQKAAPNQAPAAPKQAPATPKQTPPAPKQAPAAPKQAPAPKQTPPTPKKIDYQKIFIGVDKNGTIMNIEGKASEQSVEGTYTSLLARRKVISVENIDATILVNAEAKGDKFVIEEILTNSQLGSKQKEEILEAYTEMIELRQADPKADIFRQKSILDLHYDLRKIDKAYLTDTEREELISKAREADRLKIAKVKAGPLRAKWIWEDVKQTVKDLGNKFWNKNKAMPSGETPAAVGNGDTQENETLPPPIPPKTTAQEPTKNGHQIFAEGLGNTTYDRNDDELLPGMFEDFGGLTPEEQEIETTYFSNLKFGGNYDPVTPAQQVEEEQDDEFEII